MVIDMRSDRFESRSCRRRDKVSGGSRILAGQDCVNHAEIMFAAGYSIEARADLMIVLNVLDVVDEVVGHESRYNRRRKVLRQEGTLQAYGNLIVGINRSGHEVAKRSEEHT